MAQKNQLMASVREVLDKKGIEYSVQMRGGRVVMRESTDDYMAYNRCDCHDDFDSTDCPVKEQSTLLARRADLALVAVVLQEKGATLTRKQEVRGTTVDELYHFIIEGQEICLVLKV